MAEGIVSGVRALELAAMAFEETSRRIPDQTLIEVSEVIDNLRYMSKALKEKEAIVSAIRSVEDR